VASYSAHIEDAGLRVAIARDLYGGMLCWSTVQDDETPAWASYEGPEQQMFRRGEEVLADARRAGALCLVANRSDTPVCNGLVFWIARFSCASPAHCSHR
jgi:hypothetical protein